MTWFIIKNKLLDMYVWLRDKIEYVAIAIFSIFILIFAFARRGNVEVIQTLNERKEKEINESLTQLKEKEIEAHEAAIDNFVVAVENEHKVHNEISKKLEKKINAKAKENTVEFDADPKKGTEKISELTGFKIYKE